MGFPEAVYAVNEITDLLAAGLPAVKSIQRGTITSFSQTSNKSVTLTTTVNPDKCIVLLNSSLSGMQLGSSFLSTSSTFLVRQSIVVSLTATTLTVSACCYQTGNTSYTTGSTAYQVIEFY